jgi:hypothetical protein
LVVFGNKKKRHQKKMTTDKVYRLRRRQNNNRYDSVFEVLMEYGMLLFRDERKKVVTSAFCFGKIQIVHKEKHEYKERGC